jgi:two-component system, NtrC family, response regulator GlrR
MGIPRILIVDDDAVTLGLLNDLLRVHMPNVAVETVDSSSIALERLKRNTYDLLVTDLRMPEISGATLAQQLYELRSSIPVVLMSGARSPRSLPPNMVAYLSKPIDRDCFLGIVSRAIHYHRFQPPTPDKINDPNDCCDADIMVS